MFENLGEVNVRNDSVPQETATSESFVTLVHPSLKKYRCSLCNVELSGIKSKITHLDGKKHLKKFTLKQTKAKCEKSASTKIKTAEEIPPAAVNSNTDTKTPLKNVTVQISKSIYEKPYEDILINKSETEVEMASVGKTFKTLSLKRGSAINTKRSDEHQPINYSHEYHKIYRTRGDKWNRSNSWNNNPGLLGDYPGFNNRIYNQYQDTVQQYFYVPDPNRDFSHAFRPDNVMNYQNEKYFSNFGPPDMYMNNVQYGDINYFNVNKNETSNSRFNKIYDKKVDATINKDNNDKFNTKKISEKDLNELENTDKDFNLRKHSTAKKVKPLRNCSSPRVVSISRSARSKNHSPRQLRSSKRGKNAKEQNNSEAISTTNLNNHTKMGNSNDFDKLDKRSPPKNMSNRISHWLNPLNSRDKAELDKLMNNYSKSKKKETLLKLKLRPENSNVKMDNENLFHNLEELTDKINSAESEIEQNNENSPSPSNCLDASPDCFISSDKTIALSPKRKRRKKSNLSESSCNGLEVNTSSRASPQSSVDKNADSSKKRSVRRSRASTDSSINIQRTVPVMEYETHDDELVLGKRRSSLSLSNKPKKHKCSGSECAIECAYETKGNSEDSQSINENASSEIYDDSISISMKKEACLLTSQNCDEAATGQKEALSISMVENAKIVDVEDLMKMFALENVTIKKEFDDPLIEAIKNVDVDFLMNVCDPKTATTNPSSSVNPSPCLQSENNCDNLFNKSVDMNTTTTNPASSNNLSHCFQSTEKNCDNLLNECVDNTLSPPVESTNTSDKQYNKSSNEAPLQVQSMMNSSCNQSNNSLAPSTNFASATSLSSKKFETFETAFPGLSPFKVYVNISNELNKVQKEEEEKRNRLKEVDKMIDQHQKILNELTANKIKLQTEEDNLINRRKTLTSALSQCIISDSYAVTVDKDQTSQQPSEDVKVQVQPIDSTLLQVVNHLPEIADVATLCNSSSTSAATTLSVSVTSSISPSDNFEQLKEMTCESAKQCAPEESDISTENAMDDSEEIVIIPTEKKIADIPVIDLVDSESPTKSKDENKSDLAQIFSELIAHDTVINSVKVHNGYLYTCSNDYKAKRFNLKDSDDIVLYQHSKRNVLQLCIESYSDTTIVFTLCSMDSRIYSFEAKDGTLLKTYSLEYVCAGISNGWGKVFGGLKNGLIVACNRKDSKDLVRNLEPVKSLACTMQGGLRVIIVLSVSGQVAVRDVERNGLLIRYIKAHNDTPLFMNVYNDYVYLSSSVLLTSTNLSTGNVEKKIKMSSPITGLAAFESNIFTTAFSGIVRCYHEGKTLKMKMAYGAGRESLTCIYVHQGWVFTGNRNGVVSVFQFDPLSEFHCQVSTCKNVYIRFEDLDRHVNINSDHKLISKNSKCPWRKCQQTFKDWGEKARKNHLRAHVKGLSIHNSIL